MVKRGARSILSVWLVILAACGPTRTTTPAPSASIRRGPEVNWRGRSANEVPTAFFEDHGLRAVTYEVESIVDAALAGAPPWRGVFSDGAALYFTEDFALQRVGLPGAGATTLHGEPPIVSGAHGPAGAGAKVKDPLKELHAVSPDGRWFVGINARGLSLLSADAKTVTELPVFASENALESPAFTDDGASLFYAELASEPAPRTRVHRYTLGSKEDEVVLERPGRAWIFDARPGALLVREETLLSIDLATKAATPIDGREAKFGPVDGELVVLVTSGAAGHVERRDRGGAVVAKSGELQAPVNLTVDRASKRAAVQTEGEGVSLVALDLTTLEPLPLEVPGAARIGLESIAPGSRAWVLRVSFADRPDELHVYDWTKRADTAWHRPVACSLEGECAPILPRAPPLSESWSASDGAKQTIHVRTPPACVASPCPVLVRFVDRPSPVLHALAVAANDAGFVHVDAGLRPDVPTDADELGAHLRRALGARGQRIGAWGFGAMGARVLDVMTRSPGAFDAGLSIDASKIPPGPGSARDPICLLATLHAEAPVGDNFEFRRELERKPIDVTLSVVRDDRRDDFLHRGGYAKQLLTFFVRVFGRRD